MIFVTRRGSDKPVCHGGHARIQKIFSGGGGGGVKFHRRGLTENFNMAKTNNLAIPGGGGGGPDPLSPPLWIRPWRR